MAWPVFQGMSACKDHHPFEKRYTGSYMDMFLQMKLWIIHTIYMNIFKNYIYHIVHISCQDWKGYTYIYANTHYSTLLHPDITFHYITIAIITIDVTIILPPQSNRTNALHYSMYIAFQYQTFHLHSIYITCPLIAFTCHLCCIYITFTLHIHYIHTNSHYTYITFTLQLHYIYITLRVWHKENVYLWGCNKYIISNIPFLT